MPALSMVTPMTMLLTIIAVCAATGFYAVMERWLERWLLPSYFFLRGRDRVQLWALRIAGIWLTFWLLAPIIASAAQRQVDRDLAAQQQQQITNNAARLDGVEARITAVESLRLDARLALVEDTREEVRTMRQWLFGIFGGVAVTIIVQLLQLLGRPQQRQGQEIRRDHR